MARELSALLREIGSEMRAAAFFTRQRATDNQVCDVVFSAVLFQRDAGLSQAICAADNPTVLPHNLTNDSQIHTGPDSGADPQVCARSPGRALFRLPHRPPHASPEHQPFQQRITSQPIRPMHAGTRRLARRD